MSPAKGTGDFIGIHFTWHRKFHQILKVLPKIEETLQKFNVKPHLGKLFKLSGERFETLYGKDLQILRSLVDFHDPQGKFRNEFMDEYIYCGSRWNEKVNLPNAKL